LSFDPSGDLLLSVGDDKQILVWDTSGDYQEEHVIDNSSIGGSRRGRTGAVPPMDKIAAKVSHFRKKTPMQIVSQAKKIFTKADYLQQF